MERAAEKKGKWGKKIPEKVQPKEESFGRSKRVHDKFKQTTGESAAPRRRKGN